MFELRTATVKTRETGEYPLSGIVKEFLEKRKAFFRLGCVLTQANCLYFNCLCKTWRSSLQICKDSPASVLSADSPG